MAIVSPRALSPFRLDPVPVDWHDPVEHRRKLAEAVNAATSGKINSHGVFTITANQATSTLTSAYIGPDSFIGLEPTTANAAAEKAAGTMYVSAKTNGSATVTHANNAQVDRTFDYVVLG